MDIRHLLAHIANFKIRICIIQNPYRIRHAALATLRLSIYSILISLD